MRKAETMVSERNIEARLASSVKKAGGWAIKLSASFITGLPDRLCLMPNGKLFFVELKAPGKKPRPIQKIVINKIKKLGFDVYIIDSFTQIDPIINGYK